MKSDSSHFARAKIVCCQVVLRLPKCFAHWICRFQIQIVLCIIKHLKKKINWMNAKYSVWWKKHTHENRRKNKTHKLFGEIKCHRHCYYYTNIQRKQLFFMRLSWSSRCCFIVFNLISMFTLHLRSLFTFQRTSTSPPL